MQRPVMERRRRVRVEFGLSPDVAERVYEYAKAEGLTLSQCGERLLSRALADLPSVTSGEGDRDDTPGPVPDRT